MHRNFPAQFKFLVKELSKNPNNNVYFVTNNKDTPSYKNVHKIVYQLKREVPSNCHRYLRFYEESIIHAQAAAEALISLKDSGFTPDVIYGHTWGSTLFVKDIFPEVPLICHFEWYYNAVGSDADFADNKLDVNAKAMLRCKNSHLLLDLANCDYGISPTQWQKSQFPKEFLSKITVLHEGIDTDQCKPSVSAEFLIKDKNIVLRTSDEILTYATRGMEAYRGFPEFMRMASKLQKSHPNMHTIIAGEDRVCYGPRLSDATFKEKMLKELDFDMRRTHFTGPLSYDEYIKLLQVSTVHVYLTYPFVLSWSLLEAMSCGCCVLASNTSPVLEVIQDGHNGLLADFFDINELCAKAKSVFKNREKYELIKQNARETIVKKYNLEDLIKEQINFLNKSNRNLHNPEFISGPQRNSETKSAIPACFRRD